MPIYHYQCKSCDNAFTKNLSMSRRREPVEEECPECGKKEVGIVIYAPTITAGVGSIINKTDVDWKSKLKNMKKNYPGSTIRD